MAKTVYRHVQERTIIDALGNKQMSIQGIADTTGMSYWTCRRLVEDMFERNILYISGLQDRARLYSYNVENDEGNHIPRVYDSMDRSNSKFVYYLAVDEKDDTTAKDAARRFFTYVAKLVYYASRADKGHFKLVNHQLDVIHEQMQRDRDRLENVVNLYDQLLGEAILWDPKTLADLVNDKDFNWAWGQAMEELKNVKAEEADYED